MNRYIVVERSIPSADAVAFHVMDDVTGAEMGRYFIRDYAESEAWKLNHAPDQGLTPTPPPTVLGTESEEARSLKSEVATLKEQLAAARRRQEVAQNLLRMTNTAPDETIHGWVESFAAERALREKAEGMVAALREALYQLDGGDEMTVVGDLKKLLADTATVATEHDARIRNEVVEEAWSVIANAMSCFKNEWPAPAEEMHAICKRWRDKWMAAASLTPEPPQEKP